MKFSFETVYDQKALTVMAKAVRTTVRRKRSRRSHIFGVIVIILGLLLILAHIINKDPFSFQLLITIIAVLALIIALIFEDKLNAYVAKKRMMPEMEKAEVKFYENSYESVTAVGETKFKYENILALAESKRYFVFMFSKSHAQVYDKKSIEGGSVKKFRDFIEEKTGIKIKDI